MRKIALALAVLTTAAFSQTASAADMPAKAAPKSAAVAVPVYNWSGFYIGLVTGFGTGGSRHCDDGTCSAAGVVYPAPDIDGWLLGGTIGVNWQTGNVVLGIEGDWAWTDISGTAGSTASFGCGGTNGCRTEVNSIGTVRARLGWAIDRILPYVTAGIAWADIKGSIGNPVLASGSKTKSAFVWGLGVEFAITQQWTAKVEYLRSDFGGFVYDTAAVPACGLPAPGCSVEDVDLNLVRLGLNYKF